jgi:S1-C subfamily serine protease
MRTQLSTSSWLTLAITLAFVIPIQSPARVVCAQEASAEPSPVVTNAPIEQLTSDIIDNRRIYNTFVNRGRRLLEAEPVYDGKDIRQRVTEAPSRADVVLPQVPGVVSDEFHDRLRKASVMVGSLYDCGRCNNLHGNISGGVLVSQDGLVLTNYHVLNRNKDEKVQGMVAMNHLGQCYSIGEVLAAWESIDLALIKLRTSDIHEPVPLAKSNPKPLSNVVVMSHPHNEFFVVTTGLVSRLTKPTMEGDSTTWLEITAEFSGGSSGSGVFNSQGELVGLVSRIHPMFREQNRNARGQKQDQEGAQNETASGRMVYPEQILRRCVPVESIHKMLTP